MRAFGRACAAVVFVVATWFEGLEYFFLIMYEKELDMKYIQYAVCHVLYFMISGMCLILISVEEYLFLKLRKNKIMCQVAQLFVD